MIEREKDVCFDYLSLDRGCAYCENRFVRENGSTLGNSPDVARKAEVLEIIEKLLVKNALGAEVGDIVVVKVQLLDVVYNLLKTRGDRKTAVVGYLAVKNVEVHLALVKIVFEVAVGHGEFIEITKHRQIFFFHSRLLDILLVIMILALSSCILSIRGGFVNGFKQKQERF